MSLLPTLRRGFDSGLDIMAKEMSDFFGDALTWTDNHVKNFSSVPAIDIEEKDNSYIINADLPGIEKENIKITADNGILTISAERNKEDKKEKEGYSYHERRFGKFERKFKLTDDLDTDSLNASYKNGVLTLSITKKEKAKPKQIEIK